MSILVFLLSFSTIVMARGDNLNTADIQKVVADTLASKWYEKINIRGYAQLRYNRIFESNKDLRCSQCDKSIGGNNGFFLRRARIILFGEVSDRVYVYIQPDYASADDAGNQLNYFQMRDAYFDYALTSDKDWRVRTGISKVPWGFQNLQSSSNRPTLDRDDALNSAIPNERDTGVYLMWSPTEIRRRFKELTSNNLKGSGDYGMLAIGAHNGQTLNRPEKNDDLHRVVRFTYPFKMENGQFIEASIQAYEGKFQMINGLASGKDFYEQRTAASIVIYPQPIGFQAEYNIGSGPEYDPNKNVVRTQGLRGGYVMTYYQFHNGNDRFFPFIRYQLYDGGKKLESGSAYKVEELEIGTEWQPNSALELTVAFANSDRRTQSSTTNQLHEIGHLIRLQAQFNY
jgi:hypothetical protein